MEHKKIGCEEVLKGWPSKKWDTSQGIFYRSTPDTRGCKYLNSEARMITMIESLVGFTLVLWKDRSDTLHGANEEEMKR